MECPNCRFVVAPDQEAVEGVCPNCERPYRDQPTPLKSDMEMRNMPAPGEEDTGGNPLKEGILGDYQNAKVRDEAFASTQPDIEIPAEVTDVVVPVPESIRPDKEQMTQKQADWLGDVGDVAGDVGNAIGDSAPVWAPIAGAAVGSLIPIPGVGTAAGAAIGGAIGGGLAGGGVEALKGGDVGDIAGTAAGDAALGGIGGGIGGIGKAALAARGAEDAAAQGATRGGIGSLMKSAWGKVPTDKLKNAYIMHSALSDAQNATTPQPMMQPPMMAQPAPIVGPSYYSRTAAPTSTPTSQDHIPSNNSDDPEEVDFHERNDGEKDGLQSDISVNDIGGTDLGPDNFFAPDSGALGLFGELLPKVLQFALGDQSAAGDPDMEKLHEALEGEKPGYLDGADDDHGTKLMMFILKGAPDEESGDSLLQDNDQPHDPISEHQATALMPGLTNTCPRCGSVLDPSSEHCPQCGLGNPNHQSLNPQLAVPQAQAEGFPQATAKVASGQGPNTPQQQALVAELLIQEGRQDEIPNMLMEPHEYADELTQITGGEEPPEEIGQEGPPPPVEPPQEESQMPVPPMSGQPMMAAISKYAGTVDGICEACPNCDSHSTGYSDYENGDAQCKTCHHRWKANKLVEHSAADDDGTDYESPDDDYKEEKYLSWVDASGAPLQVGQTYNMYSGNYDIPDPVKIDAVKPEVIEYTILGEYGLSHRTEITHDEAQMENLEFVPADLENEPAPEEAGQGAEPPSAMPGYEELDSSTPHMMMSSRTADFDDTNPPGSGPSAGHPEDGALPPCPHCGQDMLQFRDGASLGPLYPEGAYDCANCHNVVRREDLAPDTIPTSVHDPLERAFQAPSVEHPLGREGNLSAHEQIIASAQPHFAGDEEDHMDPSLQWIKGDSNSPVNHTQDSRQAAAKETGPEWLNPHTAGAHMTPWEQKGYIDEIGDARNADKLDLTGTHYEIDGLDDSLLFGL